MSGKIILLQLPMPKNIFKLLTINYYIKSNIVYNEPPNVPCHALHALHWNALLETTGSSLYPHQYDGSKTFPQGVSTSSFSCREDGNVSLKVHSRTIAIN